MRKNWKTTVLGIIGGGAIALSTGNCTGLVKMLPPDSADKVGAVAGAAVALMGVLAKDADKEQK